MDKKVLAQTISAHIDKYAVDASVRVKFPESEWKFRQVFKAVVLEESLIEIGDNTWTFTATAQVKTTDERETAYTVSPCKIEGNVIIKLYKNFASNELLPEPQYITITRIIILK